MRAFPSLTRALACVLALLCLVPAALAGATPDASIPPSITVTSESINADGRLLTVCAADRSPNKPKGENQSPQVTFTPVEGATNYVVLMFDTDANWLHMALWELTELSIAQGQYADKKIYVGPYPPGGGDHHYRIEVFALASTPDKTVGKMNASNNYEKIIKALDTAGGQPGNILLRGEITGLYKNKDNTAE